MSPTTEPQASSTTTNITDISKGNSTETEGRDGFVYQKKSKAYKKMVQEKKIQILQRRSPADQAHTNDTSNPQEGNNNNNSADVKTRVEQNANSLKIPIQEGSIPILIGTRGRNISLLCKHSMVHSSIEEDSTVVFTPKSDKSDLDLAHRMMLSMVAGGVLRWFTHPSVTQKYYPQSLRPELEQMVAATSQCSLTLLRAHNGHLCLLILPSKDANKEYVLEQIRNLRPILIEKISQNAQTEPTPHDSSFEAAKPQQPPEPLVKV